MSCQTGHKQSEETKKKLSIKAQKRWANLEFKERIRKIMTKNLEERFWSKVDKKGPDECWEWKAMRNKPKGGASGGYGRFELNGKLELAHRISFLLSGGILVEGKPCVLHNCDNRSCCNPKHLFSGNVKDNYIDMINKGRDNHNHGEQVSGSKLKNEDVIIIRNMKGILSQRKIAILYGIGRTTVASIHKGKTWKHI